MKSRTQILPSNQLKIKPSEVDFSFENHSLKSLLAVMANANQSEGKVVMKMKHCGFLVCRLCRFQFSPCSR